MVSFWRIRSSIVTGGQKADTLTSSFWTYRYSVFIGLIIVVAMSVGAWFLSPKGENQTYVLFAFVPIKPPYTPFSCYDYLPRQPLSDFPVIDLEQR